MFNYIVLNFFNNQKLNSIFTKEKTTNSQQKIECYHENQ